MKDIRAVLDQKLKDLLALQREVSALRLVMPLLEDEQTELPAETATAP